MSRIGKQTVIVPAGTEVKLTGTTFSAKGPKGTLTRDFPGAVTLHINGNEITLTADSSLLSADFEGTIHFFRPSDSSKDIHLKMNFVNNTQAIDSKQLVHGAYKLQLSWTSNQKKYFKEEVIFIN